MGAPADEILLGNLATVLHTTAKQSGNLRKI
jgi:hypothetical protein